MPSQFALKAMNVVHKTAMAISGGRLGWKLGTMPVIELTTTGRKSGVARSSMLTVPWSEGEAMAIVASAGGNDTHPAWYLNLAADPNVTVRTADGERPLVARTVEGDERDELWAAAVAAYSGYAEYQRKTDRKIPVVILEPATD